MTTTELIAELSKLPPDTKVMIEGDGTWSVLENIQCIEAFNIWHSDYNSNNIPYISLESEPKDSTYVRGSGYPDYVRKTLGSEFVVSLR